MDGRQIDGRTDGSTSMAIYIIYISVIKITPSEKKPQTFFFHFEFMSGVIDTK